MCASMKNKKRYMDEWYGGILIYTIDKVLDSDKVTDTEELVTVMI